MSTRVVLFNSIVVILLVTSLVTQGEHFKWQLSQTTRFEFACVRDSSQYYLQGRAFQDGKDLQTPLAVLHNEYLNDCGKQYFAHPTPYPPTFAPLMLPLVMLTPHTFYIYWAVLLYLAFQGGMILLYSSYPVEKRCILISLCIAASLSSFVFRAIEVGNISPIVLLLYIIILVKRKSSAFVALGVAASIKGAGVFLIVRKIFERKWKEVAFILFPLVTLLIALLIRYGADGLHIRHYLEVSQLTANHYLRSNVNFSPLTIGNRLFAGMEAGRVAPLIFQSDFLRAAVAYCVPLTALIVLAFDLIKLKVSGAATRYLFLLGFCFSPVLWDHYFLLLIPSIIEIGLDLFGDAQESNLYRWRLRFLLLILLLFLLLSCFWQPFIHYIRTAEGDLRNVLALLPLSIFIAVTYIERGKAYRLGFSR